MASVTFSGARTSSAKPRYLATRRGSFLSSPRVRRLATIVAVGCVPILLAEFGLRGFESLAGRPFGDAALLAEVKLPAGVVFGGRPVNAHGYWDDDFSTAPAINAWHVALVGGALTLGGDSTTNVADRLEGARSGLQVDHFGLPGAGPAAFAAQVRRDVLARDPRLVLVVLSADDAASADAYDSWLAPRLWQWAGSLLSSGAPFGSEPTAIGGREYADYETYLRARAPFVTACLPVADAASDERRAAAQRAIAALVASCRSRDVPVALVLAPAEYQLDANLASSLCRQAGHNAERLDLDLPQRTWAAYAGRLGVPVIDLLPTFRSSGEVLFDPATARWNARGHALAAEAISGRLPVLLPIETAAK